MRSVHRVLGLALAVPFLSWTATGLLFHLKPGWSAAYETLSVERRDLPLADLVAAPASGASRVEAFATALGPMWRVTRGSKSELYDGRTGQPLSPLSEAASTALARDAVGRAKHPYGDVERAAVSDDEVAVRFANGASVSVDRWSARLTRTGADTDRIDWLYRVHYLQWTGIGWFDRAFAVLAIVGTWALTLVGARLFFRRR